MLQTFEYIPRNGIYYAQAFALIDNMPEEQRLFFYSSDDDCTNFVSQCVWAAYGGWLPGFTEEIAAKNSQLILKNVRQVSGVWYGSKHHIGSNKWCRVEEFCAFVSSKNNSQGPNAHLVADGDFNSISPATIKKGDVIQMIVKSYTPDRFGHSLYVTTEGAEWSDVHICCHTYNRLNAPMTVFSSFPEIYSRLRVLRFSSAVFNTNL